MVFAVEDFTITVAQLLELLDRDELDLDGVRSLMRGTTIKRSDRVGVPKSSHLGTPPIDEEVAHKNVQALTRYAGLQRRREIRRLPTGRTGYKMAPSDRLFRMSASSSFSIPTAATPMGILLECSILNRRTFLGRLHPCDYGRVFTTGARGGITMQGTSIYSRRLTSRFEATQRVWGLAWGRKWKNGFLSRLL
jgi:hypothetical protein